MKTDDSIDSAEVQAISDWLIERGLRATGFETLIGGFCTRLAEAGVPLARAYVSMRTLHPSIAAFDMLWRPGRKIQTSLFGYDTAGAMAWEKSPFFHMIKNKIPTLRRSLADPDETLEFSVLEELRGQGLTDYFARVIRFDVADIRSHATGVATSWSSDRPGGFEPGHLDILNRLLLRLALSLAIGLARQIAVNMLDTYVGHESGRRILAGDIRPGKMDVLPAVIWLADLRGFTAVSDTMPREKLGDMLNAYFECMIQPVKARGGQVLKFLGDGLLATFDTDADEADGLCSQALAAAAEAVEKVRALNRERQAADWPAMELDIALHLGDVLYGNVGAADRLDFTVIGPAVNEASRIESLCTPLGHNILISEAFAKAAKTCLGKLVSVGRHTLRGVARDQELFTLARTDAAVRPASAYPVAPQPSQG
ncbi:MAG: adenylate/guanylate cyclase domain-containing protein [Proteobacteria bacterium]|nr:adenylate/guanylate cyclase domain-containing protein [Pseudomonadota bacterium]